MKVTDLKVIEKVSKKGNTYRALYAILENGEQIFIAFVRKN